MRDERVSGCVTPEGFVRAVAVGTSTASPELLLLRATGGEGVHACAWEILFEIPSDDSCVSHQQVPSVRLGAPCSLLPGFHCFHDAAFWPDATEKRVQGTRLTLGVMKIEELKSEEAAHGQRLVGQCQGENGHSVSSR
jgi:hypothetical protein